MSVPNGEIVEACMPLLVRVARRKRRGGKRERVYLTAYQIWFLLEEQDNRICEALRSYGTAVGKGGGKNVGPAQRIAAALEQSDRIETYGFDTRRISVSGKKPAPTCNIFRLKE